MNRNYPESSRFLRRAAFVLFGGLSMFFAAVAASKLPEIAPGVSQETQIAGQFVHGEVKEGLAAFLMPHRNRFKIGDPIQLSYGLIFVGPGLDIELPRPLSIKVWRPYIPTEPLNYSWLEVTGSDGQRVHYTGANIDYAVAEPSDENCQRLWKGDLIGGSSELCGANDFILKKAGKYRVHWMYQPAETHGIWSGKLQSNELEIEVIDDGRLGQEDEIRETVFRWQFVHSALKQQVTDGGAFFLALEHNNKDPSEEFLKRFGDNKPPVRKKSDCRVDTGGNVLDKQTRGHGVIFHVTRIRWKSDSEVAVQANYYEADESRAGSTYTLKKEQGKWKVTDDKLDWTR
jgi:hypothetical protein